MNKDQSYFLADISKEQLENVLFPLGEYTKPEVREIALKAGLNVAKKGDIKKAIECLNENEDRDITIFTGIFFKQALYIAYHINDHNLFIKWYTKYRSSHLYNADSFNTSIISLFKDFMDGISKSEIVAKAEKILNRLEKNIDNTDDMTYILEILYHLAKDEGNNDKALSVLNELYNINKMSFLS